MSNLFVDDSEAERRLTHKNNFARVERLYRGGKTAKPNIPEELRPLIGAVTREVGTTAAAEEFGITKMTALTLSKGQSSPGYVNPELKEKVDALSNTVRESAMDKLAQMIGMVDPAEASDLKIGQKVALANQMAQVVDRLNPRGKEGINVNGNAFIVYAPPPLETQNHEFETIVIPPSKA